MPESTHNSSMHLQFHCVANERYNSVAFTKRVVHWAFVTCTDDTTFAAAVVDEMDGSFHLDLHLEGTYIVNTLKFHFFEKTGNFIASNYVDTEELLTALVHGDKPNMKARNHRVDNKIEVVLEITDTSASQDVSKKALEIYHIWKADGRMHESALHDTEAANHMFNRVAESIYNSLMKSNDTDGSPLYTIDPATGGSQFVYPLTTHAMQDQYILTLMMDQAMPPPPTLLQRFTTSGLVMYCLIDTLHFQGLTVEDALGLSKYKLAQFAVAFCQTIQRSNHECRYMPDSISVPGGDPRVNILRGTEFFKRPFCEPFLDDALWVDDCEGLGGAIKDMITTLHFLYQSRHLPDPAGRRQALFPSHLFQAGGVQDEDKGRLLELALRLGEMVHAGELRCKMVIMSCGAAYVGAKEGTEIGGHVTVSLQYRPGGFRLDHEEVDTQPENKTADDAHHQGEGGTPPHPPNDEGPFDIILEGTNCTQFDMRDSNVTVGLNQGVAAVNLSSVANALTEMMLFHFDSSQKPRFGIHFSTLNRLKTYNTVFIQGEHLLATVPPNHVAAKAKEIYGVQAADISNYGIKRELKIGFHALTPAELEWLLQFCAARSREIHSPIITHEKLDQYLRTHWQPIGLPRESVGRRDYPHLDCFVSQPCSNDPATCARELAHAQEGATRFNINTNRPGPHEPNRPWCSMRVWVSMGSLMTCLTVFTDDTTHLQQMLKQSIEYTLNGYTHRPIDAPHDFDEYGNEPAAPAPPSPHAPHPVAPLQNPSSALPFDEPCSDTS